MNWPQKIAKIAKEKQHKLLSMCSFAAKILLELQDSSLLHYKTLLHFIKGREGLYRCEWMRDWKERNDL